MISTQFGVNLTRGKIANHCKFLQSLLDALLIFVLFWVCFFDDYYTAVTVTNQDFVRTVFFVQVEHFSKLESFDFYDLAKNRIENCRFYHTQK